MTYRRNALDEFELFGVGVDADGDVSSIAFLANAWLNFELGDSGFAPSVGGGIGGVHVSIDDAKALGISLGDESDTVIGGQLGAGVAYSITESVVLSLDYRFLITDDPSFDGTDAEYQNHSVMLGAKFLF